MLKACRKSSPFQSVDEHMCNFKARSIMKQYIKNKSVKRSFKYRYRCNSETGYVYQLELYQGRKEKRELNLGLNVVLDLCQVLKDTYCHVFSDKFFNSPTLIQKFHDNGLTTLIQLVLIELTCPRWKRTKKWSEEIANANFTTTWPVSNGMTTSPRCYSQAIWKK